MEKGRGKTDSGALNDIRKGISPGVAVGHVGSDLGDRMKIGGTTVAEESENPDCGERFGEPG